jgi:hypothetical protein
LSFLGPAWYGEDDDPAIMQPGPATWQQLDTEVKRLLRYTVLADSKGVEHLLASKVYPEGEEEWWLSGGQSADHETARYAEDLSRFMGFPAGKAEGAATSHPSSTSSSGSGSGSGAVVASADGGAALTTFERTRLGGLTFSKFFRLLYVALVTIQPAQEVYESWKRHMSLAYGRAVTRPRLVEVAGDLFASLQKDADCRSRPDIELARGRGTCRAITVPDVPDHPGFREGEERPSYETSLKVGDRRLPNSSRYEKFVKPINRYGDSWAGVDTQYLSGGPWPEKTLGYQVTKQSMSIKYKPQSPEGYTAEGIPRGSVKPVKPKSPFIFGTF